MFGISMWELVLVGLVLFLVVGPSKLPGLAKSIGQGIRDLRRSLNEVKGTVDKDDEFVKAVKEARQSVAEAREAVRSIFDDDESVRQAAEAEEDPAPRPVPRGRPLVRPARPPAPLAAGGGPGPALSESSTPAAFGEPAPQESSSASEAAAAAAAGEGAGGPEAVETEVHRGDAVPRQEAAARPSAGGSRRMVRPGRPRSQGGGSPKGSG